MEKDQLASSIREIPFRIMANKIGIKENEFLSVVNKANTGKVFLVNDCAERFNVIANYLKLKNWPAIEASILYKRKQMSLALCQDNKRVCCNATEMCVLMYKSGLQISPEFQNFYSEIKPSAISRQYQDYTKIASMYFTHEFSLLVPGYGPIFPAIVNYSLEAIFNEENLLKSLLLGGILGDNFPALLE